MMVVIGWLDEFLWGSLVILQIFIMSTIMAVAWGLLGAAAKISNNRLAKSAATIYTTIFRGTPELLVILIIYFGTAAPLTLIAQFFDPEVKFFDIPPLWGAAFAVSLIIGAYATETFRGAFQGVDPGTVEAARSLGISAPKTFIYIRLPQMWRLALPGFGNHMLSLVKDTALVSVIGVEEILFTADIATSVTQEPFTFYMVAALIYLCFTTIIMYGVQLMEWRANRHLQGGL